MTGTRTTTLSTRTLAVLAALAAVGLWAVLEAAAQNKTTAGDLDIIPPDAGLLVSFRLADLWDSDAVTKAPADVKKDLTEGIKQFEEVIGVEPSAIERMTLMVVAIGPGSEPVFAVRTQKPYDKAAILKIVAPDAKEEKYKKGTLYTTAKKAGYCFLDDRSYLAGPAGEVASLLDRREVKDGPLAVVKKQAGEKHLLVAGVNVEAIRKVAGDNVPREVESFKPLLKARYAMATVDSGKELTAQARMSFETDEDAKAAEDVATGAVKLAPMGLDAMIKEVGTAKETEKVAEMLKLVRDAVKQAKVERKNAELETGLSVKVDLPALNTALVSAVQQTRRAATRAQNINNLKQLALAMHNYTSAYGNMPPPAVYDKAGKPLLSWRVMILPFIEEDALYKQFKLDEPWDSKDNKKLLEKMPAVYRLPTQKPSATETHYLAFTGNGAFFDGKKGPRFPADFTDGTSNTIMFVEAADGVPWTKPEDLPFDPTKPLPKLGGHFGDGFAAALCDGSVRFITSKTSEKTLKAAITRAGGEVLGPDW